MTRFLKKKPVISVAVIFVWGFYFFFFPFLHYHPTDLHGHKGQLQPHKHESHFHSHELEILAHNWKLHPSDPAEDEKHHRSHSQPEHDSDSDGVNFHKTSLQPGKFLKFSKHSESFSLVSIPVSSAISYHGPRVFQFTSSDHPNPFRERSPPSSFVI